LLGPPVPLPVDHDIRGLFRLTVLNDGLRPGRPAEVGLMVRDTAGHVLADAAF